MLMKSVGCMTLFAGFTPCFRESDAGVGVRGVDGDVVLQSSAPLRSFLLRALYIYSYTTYLEITKDPNPLPLIIRKLPIKVHLTHTLQKWTSSRNSSSTIPGTTPNPSPTPLPLLINPPPPLLINHPLTNHLPPQLPHLRRPEVHHLSLAKRQQESC